MKNKSTEKRGKERKNAEKGERSTIRPVWGKDYSLRPSRLIVTARGTCRVGGCKFGGGVMKKGGLLCRVHKFTQQIYAKSSAHERAKIRCSKESRERVNLHAVFCNHKKPKQNTTKNQNKIPQKAKIVWWFPLSRCAFGISSHTHLISKHILATIETVMGWSPTLYCTLEMAAMHLSSVSGYPFKF